MKHITFNPKTLLVIVLFFIALFPADAQICGNPNGVIYGLTNGGNIVPITVSNTSVGTKINAAYTTATSNANGIGYNSINGKFYYFQNGGSGTNELFVSFDPVSNTYATLTSAPISGAVNRGCVSFNGTGYYCLDASANLCYYDIPTDTWTLITSNFTDQYNNNVSSTFNAQGSGDMAIDGTGNLWIVSSNAATYGVYKINAPLPTTATSAMVISQLIAPTTATPAGVNFAGIAFNSTGAIYVSTPNNLYILNTDLSLSSIGAFSSGGAGADLTSCNFPVSTLPVTWESINASLQADNKVAINWTVNQQINTKEYNVQRSNDGKNWSDIGTVESIANNATAQSYSFTDANPLNGNNYYRISEIDFDGKENLSIIKIINLDTKNQLAIWPNPAKNIVNIQNETSVSYPVNAEIFNQSGQKVAVSVLKNGINTVNISALPAGYYIVHIDLSDGEKFNQKLVKL